MHCAFLKYALLFALLCSNELAQAAMPAAGLSAAAKVVKVYGAGGMRGLEAYQSGVLIRSDGLILTTNSLVLDQGEVTIVLHNGARYSGRVLGADPMVDIALVQIDPAGETLNAFDLASAPAAVVGEPLLILANAFNVATGDEPVSVMQGVIAGMAPLRAYRGQREKIDGAEVIIIDAVTSNPGASGGAVVDYRGNLLGLIGRELKSRVTSVWFNYAHRAEDLVTPVERILQGDASRAVWSQKKSPHVDLLSEFGFVLVPEIVPRTPAYIDYVRRGSSADQSGLQPDDLVVTINGYVASSTAEFQRIVSLAPAGQPLQLLLQRGEELVELVLPAAAPADLPVDGDRR